MKKYEMIDDTISVNGHTLHRIRALIDFYNVKAGEVGGYIENEENLSQYGDAWVDCDARVCGAARVSGNARVCGYAMVDCDAFIKNDEDYICLRGFGSENRNTTIFWTKSNGIYVRCGCFHGTLSEFEVEVKETHGDSKYAREYLACITAAKIHFEVEE